MEKEFRKGDRVEVREWEFFFGENFDIGLPKNNPTGIVVDVTKNGCWLRMDKRVKYKSWTTGPVPPIPKGYAYWAPFEELKLLEPAPLDIWAVEPPKVKQEPQEKEKIPPVWEEKVLAGR